MMRGATRPAVIVACAVVLLGTAVLLWQVRGGSETRREATTTPSTPAAARTTTPATAPTRPASVASATGSAGSATDQARPAPDPPPLDAPHSTQAPPQQGFTRDETIAKREADLKLLDDTRTRLEQDLAAARTANDKAAAHDLEVRLARLSETRKKRVDELEKIRAGGALPQ